MNVNPMVVPTLLVAAGLCYAGVHGSRLKRTLRQSVGLWCLCALAAFPAIAYALYFVRLWNEPIWLYLIRAVPGSELLAGGIGYPVGFLYGSIRTSRPTKNTLFIRVALLSGGAGLVVLPYAKQLLMPLDESRMQERWKEGVCLQSTAATCGPSCGATLLRMFRRNANEKEMARQCFTTSTGTENWYLKRALEHEGLKVQYLSHEPQPLRMPFPGIAGTRFGGPTGIGHFVAILGKIGTRRFIVGDPLRGRLVLDQVDLLKRYHFTGFFMTVSEARGAK